MKLSEFRDEEALDVLADIIDPAGEILSDKDFQKYITSKSNGDRINAVKVAIKNHKRAVLSILATLDGVPVDEYHCNILTLPIKLLEVLNDKELVEFFTSQSQIVEGKSSGSATVNTEEEES